MNTRRILTLAVIGLMPALGACSRDADVDDDADDTPVVQPAPNQALRVTEVNMGRAIDAQGRITGDETDDFGRNDTIYVSVNTEGTAPGSRLTARWTFQDGQVVDESSQTISATGPATTEFHISKPDGFPAGNYRVEIQLDGRTVETEEFTVRS